MSIHSFRPRVPLWIDVSVGREPLTYTSFSSRIPRKEEEERRGREEYREHGGFREGQGRRERR